MPTYCYKTLSGVCEGSKSPVQYDECKGKFQRNKPITESCEQEICKLCEAKLVKDFVTQGAPSATFKGKGFYSTDNE